jgi:hypothetical protein
MFRRVLCQLATLKTCLNPTAVRKTLRSLPRSLDNTCSRILSGIGEEHRELAITALRWLVVSKRPLMFNELAEAAMIQLTLAILNDDDRLTDLRGILQVLSTLVVTWKETQPFKSPFKKPLGEGTASVDRAIQGEHASTILEDKPHQYQTGDTRPTFEMVRLDHMSVKEYLNSSRIPASSVAMFVVNEILARGFIS